MGDRQALAFERVVGRLTDLRTSLEPDERAALDAIVSGSDAAEVEPHIAQADKAVGRFTVVVERNVDEKTTYKVHKRF